MGISVAEIVGFAQEPFEPGGGKPGTADWKVSSWFEGRQYWLDILDAPHRNQSAILALDSSIQEPINEPVTHCNHQEVD